MTAGQLEIEDRARRIKRVRNLANLTQEEMCSDGSINIHTLTGWEVGRHGGLSKGGAKKIVERIAKEGINCSVEWLMYGKEPNPYFVNNPIIEATKNVHDIQPEIDAFINSNHQACIFEIKDDGMLDLYSQGDLVGGIRHYGKDINRCIGKPCILKTTEGEMLARILKPGDSPETFHALCRNINSHYTTPMKSNLHLEFAAPINWIRKF